MTQSSEEFSVPPVLATAGPAACVAWSDFMTSDSFKPSTRAAYSRVALQFMRWLEAEEIGLAQATPVVVKQFLDAQHVTTSSKKQYRTILCAFFDAIVAHGATSSNPVQQAVCEAVGPLGLQRKN